MTGASPHSVQDDVAAVREALNWLTLPDVDGDRERGLSALGRIEEQLEAAREEILFLCSDEDDIRKGLREQLEAQEKMLRAYVERFGLILPTDEPRATVTYPAKRQD